MKKLILSFLILCTANFCNAQKFAYAIYDNHQYNNEKLYVSPVVELGNLNCSQVSSKNSDGTRRELPDFYDECMKKWYKDFLKSKNINILGIDYIHVFFRVWDVNKNGDMFGLKIDAEKDRLDYIKEQMKDKYTTVIDLRNN